MTRIFAPENYEALADAFVHDVNRASTFHGLTDLCIAFFFKNGVKMASYHHLPPPGAVDYTPAITVVSEGFPETWAKRYVDEELYEIDPIPRHAMTQTEPFWWFEIASHASLDKEEKRYMALLKAADFGDGLAVPVFGPNGRNAYVGLGFGAYDIEISELQISRLQSAAQLGHQRYCSLLNDRKKEDVTLSTREQEILEWIVRGKSNSVIADIIGISSYTVDTYLRRIFSKLGVSNRVTAALRGLSIGLVT